MTNNRIIARRITGIAKFERKCGISFFTGFDGRRRRVKRYRIPGTAEHGKHAQLSSWCDQIEKSRDRQDAELNRLLDSWDVGGSKGGAQ